MKKNSKLSAVFFDFDNTLVDSWPVLYKAYINTLEYFDKDKPTLEEVKLLMHKSLRDSFPITFGNNWEKASAIYYKNYIKFSHEILPYNHSEKILKFLKSNNIKTAVISNKRGDLLRKEIKELYNWDKYFDLIIGAKDTSEDKPSTIPVEFTASKLGITIDKNVWFIGDTKTDIICANDSGCFSVLYGNHNKKFIDGIKVDLNIDNHLETINELKKILC